MIIIIIVNFSLFTFPPVKFQISQSNTSNLNLIYNYTCTRVLCVVEAFDFHYVHVQTGSMHKDRLAHRNALVRIL